MENVSWPGGDNLYKFITLGGILLAALSFIFPERWRQQANENQLDAIEEMSVVTERLRVLNDQKRLLVDQTRRVLDELRELDEEDPSSEFENTLTLSEEYQRQLFRLRLENLDREAEIRAAHVRAEVQGERADYYVDQMFRHHTTAWVWYAFGAVFVLLGSIPWYVKVQKPKDLLVQQKLGSLQADSSSSAVETSNEPT